MLLIIARDIISGVYYVYIQVRRLLPTFFLTFGDLTGQNRVFSLSLPSSSLLPLGYWLEQTYLETSRYIGVGWVCGLTKVFKMERGSL